MAVEDAVVGAGLGLDHESELAGDQAEVGIGRDERRLRDDRRGVRDRVIEVPERLAVVLVAVLEVGAPDVLDGVADIERQVTRDLDALDAARVSDVVTRVVDGVVRDLDLVADESDLTGGVGLGVLGHEVLLGCG